MWTQILAGDRGRSPYNSPFLSAFFDAGHVKRGCGASLTEVARKITLEHWNASDFVFLSHTIKY